jgi:hypothetical protein
MRFN